MESRRLNHNEIFQILKAYGIPPKLMKAIESTCTNTRARVSSPDDEIEEFWYHLSWLLCKITYRGRHKLPKRMNNFTLPRRSARIQSKPFTDLVFTHDTCLLSNDFQQAERVFTLEQNGMNWGLVF